MTRALVAARCRRVVGSRFFDPLILIAIVANAVALGLETYDGVQRELGAQLGFFNDLVLAVFVVELLIRAGAYLDRPAAFFRSGWNVFDFVVVAASFVPGIRENATLLRLARLLRIVRAVRLLPDLRIVIVALGRSVPGVASLAVITLLLIYVYGMVGWVIFNEHDPANFGNAGQSMVTMFVLLTLENLPSYVARGQELSDWTLIFFVSYALIAAFLIFNLFIGIVINSMEEARALELKRQESGDPDELVDERLHTLRQALEDLESELRASRMRSPDRVGAEVSA